MTLTEIITIVFCLLLGYWIMAVFVPSLREKEDAEDADDAGAQRDADDGMQMDTELAWHDVLGVAADSSAEQITAAYRRKIREYHPDLVAQMGEDIRQLAAEKSRQINAAYDQATRLRGASVRM